MFFFSVIINKTQEHTQVNEIISLNNMYCVNFFKLIF